MDFVTIIAQLGPGHPIPILIQDVLIVMQHVRCVLGH